jgi:hypothetical protein
MKPIEIESWALRVLENVEKRSSIEDSLVELKAELPKDLNKAARRIGGHANAARGESILWLIGVDEKNGIVGADCLELSSWFSAVKQFFDGAAPGLQDVNVSHKGKTITALCFETSRFPFVVKNPAFGKVAGEPMEWEVPWREATSIRSAGRNDLILLLSPLSKLPKIEILDADMCLTSGPKPYFHFVLIAYVVPLDSQPITFPFHKCTACFNAGGNQFTASGIVLTTPQSNIKKWNALQRSLMASLYDRPIQNVELRAGNDAIEATADEIVVHGAGKVLIEGDFNITAFTAMSGLSELELTVTLTEAITESRMPLSVRIVKSETNTGTVFRRATAN